MIRKIIKWEWFFLLLATLGVVFDLAYEVDRLVVYGTTPTLRAIATVGVLITAATAAFWAKFVVGWLRHDRP